MNYTSVWSETSYLKVGKKDWNVNKKADEILQAENYGRKRSPISKLDAWLVEFLAFWWNDRELHHLFTSSGSNLVVVALVNCKRIILIDITALSWNYKKYKSERILLERIDKLKCQLWLIKSRIAARPPTQLCSCQLFSLLYRTSISTIF